MQMIGDAAINVVTHCIGNAQNKPPRFPSQLALSCSGHLSQVFRLIFRHLTSTEMPLKRTGNARQVETRQLTRKREAEIEAVHRSVHKLLGNAHTRKQVDDDDDMGEATATAVAPPQMIAAPPQMMIAYNKEALEAAAYPPQYVADHVMDERDQPALASGDGVYVAPGGGPPVVKPTKPRKLTPLDKEVAAQKAAAAVLLPEIDDDTSIVMETTSKRRRSHGRGQRAHRAKHGRGKSRPHHKHVSGAAGSARPVKHNGAAPVAVVQDLPTHNLVANPAAQGQTAQDPDDTGIRPEDYETMADAHADEYVGVVLGDLRNRLPERAAAFEALIADLAAGKDIGVDETDAAQAADDQAILDHVQRAASFIPGSTKPNAKSAIGQRVLDVGGGDDLGKFFQFLGRNVVEPSTQKRYQTLLSVFVTQLRAQPECVDKAIIGTDGHTIDFAAISDDAATIKKVMWRTLKVCMMECVSKGRTGGLSSVKMLYAAINHYFRCLDDDGSNVRDYNPCKSVSMLTSKKALLKTIQRQGHDKAPTSAVSEVEMIAIVRHQADRLKSVFAPIAANGTDTAEKRREMQTQRDIQAKAIVRETLQLTLVHHTGIRGDTLIRTQVQHVRVAGHAASPLQVAFKLTVPRHKADPTGDKAPLTFTLYPCKDNRYLDPSLWLSVYLHMHEVELRTAMLEAGDSNGGSMYLFPALDTHKQPKFNVCGDSSKNGLTATLHRICDAIGMRRIGLHEIGRHSITTRLFELGIPFHVVMQYAGWASCEYTTSACIVVCDPAVIKYSTPQSSSVYTLALNTRP
jgi:hypothetical protein